MRRYYPQYGRKTIDFLPHKTISSITYRANELGLYVEHCSIFSEEEDEIIRKYYPIEGLEVYRRLNNKTKKQCSKRVSSLNIAQNKNWTKEQDKILCEWYPKEGGKVYKRIPGKTLNACRQRARKLNVGRYDWDDDKIELFLTLLKNETNLKVIAKKMASSVGTIKKKMSELGVTNRKRKYLSSRYKFVHYDRTRKKFDVSIKVNGKILHFGRYDSEEEAAKVAMEKAKEYGKEI